MSSYDDLFQELEPQGTRPYVMSGVRVRSDRELTFDLTFAGEGNAPFVNAITKLAARNKQADEETFRTELISIFARHVIAGWRNVIGENGQPTPYKPAECEELLNALMRKKRWPLVKQMFDYAGNAENFAGRIDAGDVGNE